MTYYDEDELQEAYDDGYVDGYKAAVRNLRPNINGLIVQKLYQIRDGWGKHAKDNTISKEGADEIITLLETE